MVNVTATPDPNDLKKTGGVNGLWDAGAISVEQILAAIKDAGCEFILGTLDGLDQIQACGLSEIENINNNYNTIDYCFYSFGSGYTVQIYEHGLLRKTISILEADRDYKFRILFNASGVIEYYRYLPSTDTWQLEYTSTILPEFPLFVDTALKNRDPLDIYTSIIRDVLIDVGVVAKIDHLPLMGVH